MSRRSLSSVPTAAAYDTPPILADHCCALMARVGRSDAEQALVLGEDRLELTCALLRSGCPRVISARLDGLLPHVRVDLVVATRIDTEGRARAVVARVAATLSRTGRVVLGIAPGAPAGLLHALKVLLKDAGLFVVRRRMIAGYEVVSAQRSMSGDALRP